MNNLNEYFSELAVISHRDTGERIEVWPGLFMNLSFPVVELTNAGRTYLRALCKDYCADKVSADEVVNNFRLIAETIDSGYTLEIQDKFGSEFTKLLLEN